MNILLSCTKYSEIFHVINFYIGPLTIFLIYYILFKIKLKLLCDNNINLEKVLFF